MKTPTISHRVGSKLDETWAPMGALLATLMLTSFGAYAAAPPALTNIGNTASASFTDATGKPSIITSNPVVTVVQQVGAFALDSVNGTVVNTKTANAGGTLYAPHVLTNTGNGTDQFNLSVTSAASRFAKTEIFADDGSGNPSGPALCSATAAAPCSTATAVTVAGSNGTFKFVVAYTLPATAIGNESPYETATINAAPVAASLPMYTVVTASAKDLVNLTTGAAFTMTKSIGAPAVSAVGGGRWPTAVVGGKASSSATCPTSWVAGLESTPACVYTVYTLRFSNTGLAAGTFALSDVLPPGLTYVTGSAVWSSSPGIALTEAALGDPAGIDFQVAAGGRITAVLASVAPTFTQTLSFVVLVNSTATAGGQRTTNVAFYNPGDAGVGATSTNPGTVITPTGTTPYVVYGRFGIALGSAASSSSNALDSTPGVPNGDANDTTTVTSAEAASIVKFVQKIYNLGDANDTVNLAVSPGTFPAGTTFFLFGADGATPLQDTGVRDGIVDTGPIPAGGETSVVVAAFLPTGLPVGAVNYSAVLVGTSRNDPTKRDATRDTISAISRGLVDLTNSAAGNGIAGSTGNGDLGAGPSPLPTTTNETIPGVASGFNLYVANNDPTARVYSLAASGSPIFPGNLPANWSVKFVAGANSPCLASTPGISDTGSVSGNSQVALTACVTPGPQQVPVTAQKFYFRVMATTATSSGVIANDTKTDAVTVTTTPAQNYAAALVGNNSGQLSSPGTVAYSHILTNIGLQSCGAYTIQVTFPAAETAAGWTYSAFLANDGTPEVLVTGPITKPLLPGAGNAQKILVRISAPAGLLVGSSEVATVTASFAAPNSCGSPAVTDLTTITTGSIRVYKTQAIDALCDGAADVTPTAANLVVKPGSCIYYNVRAVNEGSTPVSNLTIYDRVPSYTTLSAIQPAVKCVATNNTGTMPTFSANGSEISCGSASSTLNPLGTVTLDYSVVIDK